MGESTAGDKGAGEGRGATQLWIDRLVVLLGLDLGIVTVAIWSAAELGWIAVAVIFLALYSIAGYIMYRMMRAYVLFERAREGP